ncbi:hypothetical protein [Fodinibius halophilus]|uniref:Uncharacterized protein n=1 Tax=Fodinibius halophilus TaxID=1736908 RepID=A0A6M1T2J1_9BACT|nr:hypothetical protein [Fodinibius halophilus]NGP88239.1 hypothetical protein [Fodinibius halophilus]
MEKQRWQRIERIIEESWTFETLQEKKAHAKKACNNNTQLYKEVIALLKGIRHAERDGFME